MTLGTGHVEITEPLSRATVNCPGPTPVSEFSQDHKSYIVSGLAIHFHTDTVQIELSSELISPPEDEATTNLKGMCYVHVKVHN